MPAHPRKINISRKKATDLIRKAAGHTELILLSDHAKKRMLSRQVTLRHIVTVLKSGHLVSGPFLSLEHDAWECSVQGFCAGKMLFLEVGLHEDQVIVVTVIWIKM